ncbi:hypothetical protein BT69DRAFT_1299713 [Atractiella rhizophila]|nr:hypothetical protein BT69DRAFT_1299713 [Atractiella rhizophila]
MVNQHGNLYRDSTLFNQALANWIHKALPFKELLVGACRTEETQQQILAKVNCGLLGSMKKWRGLLGCQSFRGGKFKSAESFKAVADNIKKVLSHCWQSHLRAHLKLQRIATTFTLANQYNKEYDPGWSARRHGISGFKCNTYWATGLNDHWAFDQHDKIWNLAPCWTGWMVWTSSVGTSLVDELKSAIDWQVLPRCGTPWVTQSDFGNENHGPANAHTLLHRMVKPELPELIVHRWCPDKKNIKSEQWWSGMRRQFSPTYENLMQDGVDRGTWTVVLHCSKAQNIQPSELTIDNFWAAYLTRYVSRSRRMFSLKVKQSFILKCSKFLLRLFHASKLLTPLDTTSVVINMNPSPATKYSNSLVATAGHVSHHEREGTHPTCNSKVTGSKEPRSAFEAALAELYNLDCIGAHMVHGITSSRLFTTCDLFCQFCGIGIEGLEHKTIEGPKLSVPSIWDTDGPWRAVCVWFGVLSYAYSFGFCVGSRRSQRWLKGQKEGVRQACCSLSECENVG